MGGVFITSTSQATVHRVYGIEQPVPAIVIPSGTGVVGMVGRFSWGPDSVVTVATSQSNWISMFGPFGMPRNTTGWNAARRKNFPDLRTVRVVSSTAAAASATFSNVTPVVVMTVVLKYKGTAGNSVTGTVSNASDGDANHFNFTVSVTNADGTTSDTAKNVNFSGVGADTTFVATDAQLIGSITKTATGRPLNGSTTFTGGVDGTVAAADYVGTAGSGDKGFAAMENDSLIRHVFSDDMGAGLRAAVNAGLLAHVDSMGDRVGYVDGPSGETIAAALTNAGNYRLDRIVYCDPWERQFAEDGSLVDVPDSSYKASVASQLPPSVSIAWKANTVSSMLIGIQGQVTPRGNGRYTLEQGGIATTFRQDTGDYSIETDVVTTFPINAATGNLTRRRMTDYIVVSLAKSLRQYVDAPNIEEMSDEVVQVVDDFLQTLKNNRTDYLTQPFIVDYQILDMATANTDITRAQGYLFVPFAVRTAKSAEKIFLMAQVGPTVKIEAK